MIEKNNSTLFAQLLCLTNNSLQNITLKCLILDDLLEIIRTPSEVILDFVLLWETTKPNIFIVKSTYF